ncbi:hypothetical protein [Streptomyces sp. 8N706]|uniref:hypothetical protein n=1 Tax=Streptomyces sp. 8N706 TaxID=3457416 RepID=UPI003FCF5BAD
MRTAVKVSAVALAVAAAISTSATTAIAQPGGAEFQANACGNTSVTAFAFDDSELQDIEQEAEGPVFCQNGTDNSAISYTPYTSIVTHDDSFL